MINMALYRYNFCLAVSESWLWLKCKLKTLDDSLTFSSDSDILSLNFPKGLRENAILWMIGIYVELVDSEVVLKENSLTVASMTGYFKQQKLATRYKAIPDLGVIVGIDTDAKGIG